MKAKAIGPWTDELDHYEWGTKAGFRGEIKRNHSGALCGYIHVTTDHPWHGEDYSDMKTGDDEYGPLVHGGLTYCGPVDNGDWRLGFDCAHLGDIVPTMLDIEGIASLTGAHGEIYRDWDYVTAEVESLARQATEPAVEKKP